MNVIDRAGCAAARHGDYNAYRRGCRCADAREDRRLYVKRLREKRQPAGMVPAVGTVRRMRALAAIGWAPTDLAPHLGSRGQVLQIRAGRTDMVTALTARRVAAVYDRLSGTPGTSVRVRLKSTRSEWAPPLAWEDTNIDDPAAVPDFGGGGQRPVGNVRRAHPDDVVHLHRFGMHPDRIADRLGVATGTVQELLRQQRKAAA